MSERGDHDPERKRAELTWRLPMWTNSWRSAWMAGAVAVLGACVAVAPVGERERIERIERLNEILNELVVKARLLEEEARYEEAGAQWIKATGLRVDYFPGYVNAAEAYQKVGRFRESLEFLQTAKGLRQDRAEPFLLAGNARFNLRDYGGAWREWEVLLKKEPNLPENNLLVGEALEARGNWGLAIERYEKAVNLAPSRGDIWFRVGRIQAQAGDIEKSLESLQKARNLGVDLRLFEEEIRLGSVRRDARFNRLLGSTPGKLQEQVSEPLFKRLGGFPAIDIALDKFVEEVKTDPNVDYARLSERLQLFRKKLAAQVCQLSNGPCKDLIRDSVRIRLELTEGNFGALLKGLQRSLDGLAVGQSARNAFLDGFREAKAAVVSN